MARTRRTHLFRLNRFVLFPVLFLLCLSTQRCSCGENVCEPGTSKDCYSGPLASKGKGSCKLGKSYCNQEGKWEACQGDTLPIKESCDGEDNDCDGIVDEDCACKKNNETRPCYTGSKDHEGKGACKSGVQTCIKGQWSGCVGETLPTSESCDGQDNDCDGTVDEDCACKQNGQKRACYTGPDGTKGKGPCKEGIQECVQGVWEECKNQILPVSEACDGKDNNCNGVIDEHVVRSCYSGDSKTAGIGGCKKGLQLCENGKWQKCTGEVTPKSEELCNKVDDNCDGKVDEGCFSLFAGKPSNFFDTISTTRYGGIRAIAASGDGNVYVATTAEHRVLRIEPSKQVRVWAGDGIIGFRNAYGHFSRVGQITGMTTDSDGNVYFSDIECHCIRKIDRHRNVTTFAGSGKPGLQDGAAAQARFNWPAGLKFDKAGNLYVADFSNSALRKIASDGTVSTIHKQTPLYAPSSVTVDGTGNIYVASQLNHQIVLFAPGKKPEVIAGNGKAGFADGTGSSAQFNNPHWIDFDKQGNLLIADMRNNRIRSLNPKTKQVSTWFGDGQGKSREGVGTKGSVLAPRYFTRFNNGWLVSTGGGGLWHIDDNGKMILFSGQPDMKDGDKKTAVFGSVVGMVLDPQENLYMSMSNRIVKLDKQGNLKTIAGNGIAGFKDGPAAQAQFNNFAEMVFDKTGNFLYIADTSNQRIRVLDIQKNTVSTFAGDGTRGFKDGPVAQAQFASPVRIALNKAGTGIFVADYFNQRIRFIDFKTKAVSTLAGTGSVGHQDGDALKAKFRYPIGLAVLQDGSLAIAEVGNRIRKLKDGKVTTLAGTGQPGHKNGPAAQAQFQSLGALALAPNGDLYVLEGLRRRIRILSQKGEVSTLLDAKSGTFKAGKKDQVQLLFPSSILFSKTGDLYFSDSGGRVIVRWVSP